MQKVTSLSNERQGLPLAEQWEEEETTINVSKKNVDGILINLYMLRNKDLHITQPTLSLGLHWELTRKTGDRE